MAVTGKTEQQMVHRPALGLTIICILVITAMLAPRLFNPIMVARMIFGATVFGTALYLRRLQERETETASDNTPKH